MKQLMKPMEANPMRLLAGACSLVLTLGAAHAGLAQQTAKAPALAQPVATAPTHASSLDAFAPTSFSALPPGAAPAQVAKPVAEEEEESEKPGKTGGNGIKVHGHWVLQVKNADGTLGERREFENSLVTTSTAGLSNSGSQLMAAMLSGNVTVGDPGIGLIQGPLTGNQDLFCSYTGANGSNAPGGTTCYIFSSSNSLIGQLGSLGTTNYSNGLTYMATFTPSPSIVLSGNYIVPSGLTSIAGVQSLYGLCIPSNTGTNNYSANESNSGGDPTVLFLLQNTATFRNADIAPLNCKNSNSAIGAFNQGGGVEPTDGVSIFALTSTAVPGGPMLVNIGQVVQISVTITFS